ncbi:related to Serine/threonine kinase [Ustilago trichophora]|uniref:Related to Serine/threonine kinase n=1 Tax=Ustilago trichophora TaxID=86804 RepID=A0A5C3DZT4_9BASI|nr:related to Serine/threonine kinase [Ustilago trichophora]
MLRNPQRDQEAKSSLSLASRMARYRRPSNASPLPSHPSPSPRQYEPQSPHSSKYNYLSPEERRHADVAWSDTSISPYTSQAVSPSVNYDRELPDLPPDALSEIDGNQLASRDFPRTDEEVRSRHFSQYEPLSALSVPSTPSAVSASSSKAESSKQSAALRFASASTSAAVSAGLGLKKLGKKASAARLRRPNTTQQQAQERDASYSALRSAGSSKSGTDDTTSSIQSNQDTPTTSFEVDQTRHLDPYNTNTFVDSADPAIGLPYDVSHNVHVDIGPHGYTGLPSSWAQVLLQEGMNQQDIYDDPQAAARFVEEKTEYFVQRAVESGADPDDTRRILTQRLAADADLSALLATTPSTRPSRPRRDSVESRASSSYSSVLDKGWDLSSPPKLQAASKFSPLPAKSPLLPDFAAEDYDDWASSLLSSIPSNATESKAAALKAAKRASHRRSRSLSQLVGANSLNGLGIGIAADDTPRRTVQRERDLLSASNATPKASQRMRASIGLDARTARAADDLSLPKTSASKLTQSLEDEVQERLRESLDIGKTNGIDLDEDDEVEHVQIAQAAIATKGVLRPVRASQLSARKVSPSAASLDFGSPHMSPSGSVSDLHARSSRSPSYNDGRSPSSLSDTRMSRSGSTESYATAGSRPGFVSRGSFSNAPPKIYTENVSTYVDRDMTSSPLETSSSGHSSMRMRSPALTVATSSMGHGSHPGYLNRASPSPSLSVRDSVSPEVPPKDGDWRSRSPALSVSASESGDGAASPAATSRWRIAKKGPSSLDSGHGHVTGHQTQDSWTSTAPSITSSDGSHSVTRGLGLRERRQAPPRIYPPSTSTRWAQIAHHDDSNSPLGVSGSVRRPQQSPTAHAPMQRKPSVDSLSRPDRSPMSDHSPGSVSLEYGSQSTQSQHRQQQQQVVDRSSLLSAQSDGDAGGFGAQRRPQYLPSTTSPVSADGRSPLSGFHSHSPGIGQGARSDRGRGSISSYASSRDSMGPPLPPPKPTVVVRRQPEYIMPGADGFYTMPSNSGPTQRGAGGSTAATSLHHDRLRPPPLSPALSPSSSTEASDYQATIEEWMRDDFSDRSPATTTFSEACPSPSSSSRDSPLPPLPKEEEENSETQRMSPYMRRPAPTTSSPGPESSESTWRKAKPASPAPPAEHPSQGSASVSVVSASAPRLASIVPPRLELSEALRGTSSFATKHPPPPSPGGSVEMLDDNPHRAYALSQDVDTNILPSRVSDKKGERIRERDRDDTRSIISIGPRAREDARRFPVSMHYASGFDTASMLGDDSEAIRSFRELMLARQSMDLEEMLPMQMGLDSAPPVPALPSMKELEAKLAAADQLRAEEALQPKSKASVVARAASQTESVLSAASPSFSITDLDAEALPPKLSHLREALNLQTLRKDVLQDLQMIGDGESGPVFAANDVVKKRRVAIKMVQFAADVNEEPSARLLGLSKEVRVWRRCRHVNVLDLYSTVLADNSIWIVQELAERSLADVIAWKDSGVDLNEARMSRIMGDLLEALQFLHGKGVLHRDVRSDNVMVSSSGVCKLSDFTHAGELSAGVTSRHSVIGTPYWMAPEVIKADSYDMRCDVWSLGVVLWEMIEGDPPRVDFPPLRAITLTATLGLPALKDPSSLSHELKSFLHWATEMDAEKRPSAEMLAMSDFLSDPCSRASIVAMLEEARNAEMEAERLETAEGDAAGASADVGQDAVGDAVRANVLRQRDSWSSDSTTKG